jgi:hypothetical protein
MEAGPSLIFYIQKFSPSKFSGHQNVILQVANQEEFVGYIRERVAALAEKFNNWTGRVLGSLF